MPSKASPDMFGIMATSISVSRNPPNETSGTIAMQALTLPFAVKKVRGTQLCMPARDAITDDIDTVVAPVSTMESHSPLPS